MVSSVQEPALSAPVSGGYPGAPMLTAPLPAGTGQLAYEPGYEGPPRYLGAPRAGTGPMPRATTGPFPRPDTGPMPRATTGSQPRLPTGPFPRPGTGPMPRAATGPMAAMGDTPSWPSSGHPSGPMPRAATGPFPSARGRWAGAPSWPTSGHPRPMPRAAGPSRPRRPRSAVVASFARYRADAAGRRSQAAR